MKKILVIEDEPDVRANLLKLLDAEGFEALEAADGSTGVELARQQVPDLILCDIMMPDLDGYEVLEALRQTPNTKTIPFIFLTAKAENSDWRHGMELGADDYLIKPFNIVGLLGAISMRLKKHEIAMQQYKEVAMQQYRTERKRADTLLEKCTELEQIVEAKDELLKSLSQELRKPLSNINMAIHMLKKATTDSQRDRYIEILKQEFACEIALINQVSELQQVLTPETVKLLSQFKLLKNRMGDG